MTIPTAVINDACNTLWDHVAAGRGLPRDAAIHLHDALLDLAEMLHDMEATWLGQHLVAGETGPAFPDVPTIATRRSAALTRAGNVVWFPLAPRFRLPGERTISGCFPVVRGGGDAA